MNDSDYTQQMFNGTELETLRRQRDDLVKALELAVTENHNLSNEDFNFIRKVYMEATKGEKI